MPRASDAAAEPVGATGSVSLISLAMLKVNAEEKRRDYLDYLIPFIDERLAAGEPQQINDLTIRDSLRTHYGLNFPRQVISLCLKRLHHRGVLARGIYGYSVLHPIKTGHLEDVRKQTTEKLASLVTNISAFAQNTYGLKWNSDQATEAVAAYLTRFGIECLRAFTTSAPIQQSPASKDRAAHYVVSAFIREAQASASADFENMLVLVKGHMLANALLCPDLKNAAKKFSNLQVFVDTPLVVRLLGLSGPEAQEAGKELLHLVRQLSGRIAIFSHTAREVHGVLRAAASHLDDPRAHGRLVREMRQRRITPADLLLLASRLDSELMNLGLARVDTPKYLPEYQVDEKLLEAALDEDIRYLNPRALQHDINSIRSIYTLRSGKEPVSIEECVAVFVTSNAALAKVAYHFGQRFESTREISPVITDFSLANIAWLKMPFAVTDLPKLELVAICYAALTPDERLWRRYVEVADQLKAAGHISPRDHSLLRTSLAVQKELLQLTLGSEENLTEETVTDILARVKLEFTSEGDARLAEEQALHARTKAEMEAAVAAQEKLLETQRQLYARITAFSSSVGQYARWTVFVVLFATILGASFLLSEPDFIRRHVQWFLAVPVLAIALSYAAYVLTITHEVFGFSVSKLAARAGDRVQRAVFRVLEQRLFGKPEKLRITTLGLSCDASDKPVEH